MLENTKVPIMQKAVQVIYDMSEDTKFKESARIREKALHDEASLLRNAEKNGIAKGKAERDLEIISKMKALGYTEEQIWAIYGEEDGNNR